MNKDRRKRLQEICDILEEQQAALEEIRDEEQESFDNLPESLQCTERGQALEESAGDLDSACSDLESLRDTLVEILER